MGIASPRRSRDEARNDRLVMMVASLSWSTTTALVASVVQSNALSQCDNSIDVSEGTIVLPIAKSSDSASYACKRLKDVCAPAGSHYHYELMPHSPAWPRGTASHLRAATVLPAKTPAKKMVSARGR
jgi:hypothetical protein